MATEHLTARNTRYTATLTVLILPSLSLPWSTADNKNVASSYWLWMQMIVKQLFMLLVVLGLMSMGQLCHQQLKLCLSLDFYLEFIRIFIC